MNVSARHAVSGDIPEIMRLYRSLEAEMIPLEQIWPTADGIPAPEDEWLEARITDPQTIVLVGEIDRVPVGFLIGIREDLPPQAAGARIGAVRYVFTEQEAREVGVGEAMIDAYLAGERAAGIRWFDAHVTPGHRLTKNFFESNGFSARRIVMHHHDDD